MKTLLPIVLVIALVFGVTFITQFTPATKNADRGDDSTAGGGGPPPYSGPPVVFGMSEVKYDPASDDSVLRRFSGYFEVGTEDNFVPFFFRNPGPKEVRFSTQPPSCTKCTAARGAVIPPEAFDAYLTSAAAGTLWSPVPVPNLLTPVAWGELYRKLSWHHFDFSHPEQMMAVPPAPAPDRPTWGVIELRFKINQVAPPAPVSGFFTVHGPDGQQLMALPVTLTVTFAGQYPFDVIPTEVSVGELPEGVDRRTFELYCWSATRDLDRFSPPPAVLPANGDPFVVVGPAVPLTEAERAALASRMSGQFAVRVRSGYKYPVSILREAGGKSLDIGPLEKELFVAGGGADKTYRVQVHGTVTGLLRLEGGGGKIDLGGYTSEYELSKTYRVWTDREGVGLELVPDQSSPRFVKYTLGPPEKEAGRTYWPIKVHIAPREGRYPPWNGTVFLRTKGPNPINVRIPVSGRGQ